MALDHVIVRKVVKGDQRAPLLQIVHEFLCHRPVIEIVGVGGDALEGARQLGLAKAVAGFIVVAVALEDALGVGETRKLRVVEFGGFFLGELESIRSQGDRRGHDARQIELAVLPLCVGQAGDGSGSGNGAIAENAGARNDGTARVLVHRFGRRKRRLFAVINERGAAVMGA